MFLSKMPKLHTFPYGHWIMPDSKFLFNFHAFLILTLHKFRKNVFVNKMLYKSGYEQTPPQKLERKE